MQQYKHIYFLGIGGIGMSALARYFHTKGIHVAGYDKTPTPLTKELESEGIHIHFEDAIESIPPAFKQLAEESKKEILIVFTPAVPKEHKELNFFRDNHFTIKKRAEVLGLITANTNTVAVAGTHGKTTTSSLVAHLLKDAGKETNAFLGGITQNYQTNLLLSADDKKSITVVEADEYDRSFLTLHPTYAIVTSVDADHLDIYGDHNHVKESFELFTKQIKKNGFLVSKKGLKYEPPTDNSIHFFQYSLTEKADFYAEKLRIENGNYYFDFIYPSGRIENISFGIPGSHNVENAIAAGAIAHLLGLTNAEIKSGLATFKGVKRRFEYILKTEKLVFIDDYAHHPEELKACFNSVKEMYPGKKITAIFQPHLYTRTRDFADAFAESLSIPDEIILLDIYPARELPIEGVNSTMLLSKIKSNQKQVCTKENIFGKLNTLSPEILLTVGAGDIDTLVTPIKNYLEANKK